MKKAKTALLIIDMINTLEFPEWKQLVVQTRTAAEKIATLRERFHRLKLPVIYVNDNFGRWTSDWKEIFKVCSRAGARGAEFANLLKPTDQDYFVLKPRHSGFHSTSLEILLDHLGVETVIVTGIAGNICVLLTAHDAHMREFKVVVPSDTLASNTKADNRAALQQLKSGFKISTPQSSSLKL